MGIKFKLVEKKDMTKGAGADAKRFYPVLVNNGRVSFEDLCEEVAVQSSLTSGDVKNCMDRVVYCSARHLKEGRSVDLGDLGTLRVSLRSEGTVTAEEYSTNLMREPGIIFNPGRRIKEMRTNEVYFERVGEGGGTTAPDDEEETPGTV